jgi:tRNA threonylcarbamoyladenosine biosynthesis protein TsaE
MAESRSLILADAQATRAAGARLAEAVLVSAPERLVIYLEGDLGAGKTTLARGFLQALGHASRVPSPTYTLIEPYSLSRYRVYHIDLYRIRDARELADLDLAGQLTEGTVALIEWPDHGRGHVPSPDLRVLLEIVASGRRMTCQAISVAGAALLRPRAPQAPASP